METLIETRSRFLDCPLNDLAIPQPRSEFDRLVNHYLERELPSDGEEWARIMGKHAESIRKDQQPKKTEKPKTFFQKIIGHFNRTDPIRDVWEKQWTANLRLNEHYFSRELAPSDYEWGDRCLQMRNPGSTLTRILLIANAIKKLQPESVIEVGCGDGLNLFFLSSLFPKIRFTGVELTAGGVNVARQFQEQQAFPEYMARLFPDWDIDRQAFKRVEFRQGSAAALKWKNNSFDMVMSCVALEQMEAIRDRVLSEVARIARRWAALHEPFRDFNSDGIKRDYVKTYNYFAGSISELPRYGLKPGFICADIPQKPKYANGLVVSTKVN